MHIHKLFYTINKINILFVWSDQNHQIAVASMHCRWWWMMMITLCFNGGRDSIFILFFPSHTYFQFILNTNVCSKYVERVKQNKTKTLYCITLLIVLFRLLDSVGLYNWILFHCSFNCSDPHVCIVIIIIMLFYYVMYCVMSIIFINIPTSIRFMFPCSLYILL